MLRKVTIVLNLLALLAAALMTYRLLTMPMYTGVETFVSESGSTTIETTKTLVEVNGRWVIYTLVGLVIASGVPLLSSLVWPRSQLWVTWLFAIILLVYSILGGLSIGLAYMPSALLLLISGVLTLFIRKEGDQKIES